MGRRVWAPPGVVDGTVEFAEVVNTGRATWQQREHARGTVRGMQVEVGHAPPEQRVPLLGLGSTRSTVATVDTEWMRARLEDFIAACQEYKRRDDSLAPGRHWDERTMRPVKNRVEQQIPTVRRIIESLDRGLIDERFGRAEPYGGLGRSESVTRMALATLKDREEWSVRLAPDAPTFSADTFHPWIWGAAAQFWDAGQHATAVEYGAKSLNAHMQQKSGLTLADRELAAEAFSPKPSAKNTRLWLPGTRTTDTWRSRQDGLHHLAMGAFAGIRNVVTHSVEPGWSEQEALEYLGVLSTVARWTDHTEVVPPTL